MNNDGRLIRRNRSDGDGDNLHNNLNYNDYADDFDGEDEFNNLDSSNSNFNTNKIIHETDQ